MGQTASIKTAPRQKPSLQIGERRTLGRKKNHSIVLQKVAWETYLIILTHSALQTKGLLDAVRNVGVLWCRFTRNPGIEGEKLQSLHKKVQQETWGGEKNTHPDEALTFHGKRSVHSIFSLRLALFRERRAQGARCAV